MSVCFRLGNQDPRAGSYPGDQPVSATMADSMAEIGIFRQIQHLDQGGACDIEDDHPGPASVPTFVSRAA